MSPRKRPDGALEADVLGVLWAADGQSLSPAEVNERLPTDLAYTTIMTVLTRLWKKGLAERVEAGRGYAYRATYSESELTSQRIRDMLDHAHDRASALAGFVDSLDTGDIQHLRRLLAELDEET
ncbi:MAG: BlaI/MecI/CopY family transcriptional regulator [Acidimicrobiales bacterium]